jgi:hypothetical protein
MRERAEQILRIACLILAAFVVYELAGIALRLNPFHGVSVPALPALAAATNSPPGGGRGTNLVVSKTAAVKGTNQISAATNAAPQAAVAGTNSASPPVPVAAETNSAAHHELAKTETNLVPHLETKVNETNSAPSTTAVENGTNLLAAASSAGTNGTSVSSRTNSVKPGARSNSPPQMAGMNLNSPLPPRKPGSDLPPAVQAQISRITDSEILGPVVHPLPMGLTGIAGDVAFLRTATGQTGLVKEGDSLGDLKLLRIGINRVLVEEDGQKKELMIFSGYGGDSLLSTNTPDENDHP